MTLTHIRTHTLSLIWEPHADQKGKPGPPNSGTIQFEDKEA
jgi:hypothetical protein